MAYSLCSPSPAPDPRLLAISEDAASLLGLSPEMLSSPEAVSIFGGSLPKNLRPWAARYGGHQFGGFAGQLGDGRAISIGEVQVSEDRRWELQLKGAGR